MRILYVEDNPLDAALATRELQRGAAGHRVETASTLAAAWAALAKPEPFDLALVDLDLPDGSGIEFVIGVRSRELPLPLVMLTGSGDERSAVASLKAGADDYLVKAGDYLRQLPQVIESARDAFRLGLARRTRPLRVLYAEPNAADVDIARRHLARHAPHLAIDSVAGGDEVLALLAEHPAAYDVVLLDYRLRGLDAIEVIRLLQERGLMTVPIVLVTGQGDEAVAVKALRLGAADYLVKRPGYLHEMAATLENTHHRALLWREQMALAASEERFRQLAENIDEVFWIALPDGVNLLYASPAYETVWGRSSTALLARPDDWLDAVWAEDRERVRAWLKAATRGEGARQVIEYRIVRQDGAVRWIRDRASPVRNADGVVYRLVGVAEDITERRHLEDQFRQSQKMEAIGQLSGGVAHDFNNLLTIIHGHLGLLEAGGQLTPEVASSIEQISQAATRASNLTRQLLTFSRKQVMRSRDLDLRTVVADLTKMLQRILGEDVEMIVNSCERPLWVHADPGMMEQILMNLTVNARDAMPRGGRLTITLEPVGAAELEQTEVVIDEPTSGTATHGYARLTVGDTGTGIAPELMAKIFEPFFTTKEVGKGTGLGLATVYGIVRQHRGGVRAIGGDGRGATFEVYLPQVAPPGAVAAAPEEQRAATPAKAPSEPESVGGTILLVEDEPAVSAMVSLSLEWSGYRVLVASSGSEALDLWTKEREEIDLLLTDLVMPNGVSGHDLARRLLADDPTLPVIYMSGYSAEIAGRDIGDLDAVNFLPKPFSVDALRRMVGACVRRRA